MKSESLKEHRKWLADTGYQVSRDFDKAAMTISSGGILVSFALIEKVLHGVGKHTILLELAWGLFASSLLSTFISLFTSQVAMATAAEAVDKGIKDGDKLTGGKWGDVTVIFNFIAGLLAILGVVSLMLFAGSNLKQAGVPVPPIPKGN